MAHEVVGPPDQLVAAVAGDADEDAVPAGDDALPVGRREEQLVDARRAARSIRVSSAAVPWVTAPADCAAPTPLSTGRAGVECRGHVWAPDVRGSGTCPRHFQCLPISAAGQARIIDGEPATGLLTLAGRGETIDVTGSGGVGMAHGAHRRSSIGSSERDWPRLRCSPCRPQPRRADRSSRSRRTT